MEKAFQNLCSGLFSISDLQVISYLPNLVSTFLVLFLIWISKKLFDLFTGYSLDEQLVKKDNKAITTAFVGYLAGVSLILEGVLSGEPMPLVEGAVDIFIWGLIGILLLNIAGKLNAKLILKPLKSSEELLEKQNIGIALVFLGGYIGSAFIIRSIILGETLGWQLDIALTLLFFLLAQIIFFVYSILYQKVIQYDLKQELKEGKVAAGISFGLNLIAIGILLSVPLQSSFSIVLFLIWFICGAALLALFRFLMDKVLIPMEKLDEEIHIDNNWGVALLEGCFIIGVVICLRAIFL